LHAYAASRRDFYFGVIQQNERMNDLCVHVV